MAELSFQRPFQAADIEFIKRFNNEQPVWLLGGTGGSSLVIKAETLQEGSNRLAQVSEVMSLISPSAKMKNLDVMEKTALVQWAQRALDVDDGSDQFATFSLLDLVNFLGMSTRTFVKMDTLRLTTLDQNDEKTAKRIGKALNAPGGLEDLGEIIAADMFNGNHDRFNFSQYRSPGAKGGTWGDKQLNYLVNPGNIMIQDLGNERRLVGMDPFDRSSVTAGFEVIGQGGIASWGFVIFHPDNRNLIPALADYCAKDLRTVIGKKGIVTRYGLDKKSGDRIAKGMVKGAERLEMFFRQKYNFTPMPDGIRQRAQLAGWEWCAPNAPQRPMQQFLGLNRQRRSNNPNTN